MKLYEVIFWGSNSPESQDSHKDTIYLVRAPDFRSAINEVSVNSSPSHHGGAEIRIAHRVLEIGEDLAIHPAEHPQVLRGPYFESAYNRGWRAWDREIVGSEHSTEWTEDRGFIRPDAASEPPSASPVRKSSENHEA